MAAPTLTVSVGFAADPLEAIADTGYLNLPGTGSGNYASTPDKASLDITGDIEIVMRLSADDWTPSTQKSLISKRTTAAGLSWQLVLSTAGTLAWSFRSGSTDFFNNGTLTAGTPLVDGTTYWVKFTRVASTGVIAGYSSADSATEPSVWDQTWTPSGTRTAGNIDANAAELALGATRLGLNSDLWAGKVYRCIIRNSIGGGSAASVFDMDFASTIAYSGQTSLVESVASAVVTVNGTASTVMSSGWTDVTSYVRQIDGVDIDRGRSDPLGPFNAGRLSLTLSNRDRRFDPYHSTGPYYGNLKPRKQIRVTATSASVTYDVFRGFVGRWPQQFRGSGKDAVVALEAYDALDWAGGARLSTDPVEDYVESIDTPVIWLRQAEETSWPSYDGTSPLRVSGQLGVGSSMVAGLSSNSVQLDGASYVDIPTDAGTLMSTATVSIWFKVTSSDWLSTVPGNYLLGYGTISSNYDAQLDTDGTILVRGVEGNTNRRVTDGAVHHLVITASASGAGIYLDGVLQDSSAALHVWYQGAVGAHHHYNSGTGVVTITKNDVYQIQDYLLMDVALTAAQVNVLYRLGYQALNETSADRVGRLLDTTGWPAAWRDITTNPRATVGELVYNNRQLITALQEVERSEQGRIFASKSGDITFHSRYHYLEVSRGMTSQATFSDDGSNFSYISLSFDDGDEQVRNDVTVKGVYLGGTELSSRSTDATSIGDFGRRSETVNTILQSTPQVSDMAKGLLYRWKNQAIRIDAFTAGQPSTWATYLGLELGDRITVESTPMATGSQIAVEFLIDALRWSISDQGWWLTIGASPVPAGVFVLDDSLLDGADVLGF